jgi:hypothetical protein
MLEVKYQGEKASELSSARLYTSRPRLQDLGLATFILHSVPLFSIQVFIMSEVIVPQKTTGGIKRDHQGNQKLEKATDAPPTMYTSMFEGFREELDEHHDRRQRIGKVSRDVTALSKKM